MTDFPLHYIGSRVYDVRRFVHEAKRKGVNRALPRRWLQALKWDDTVLLATWTPAPRANGSPPSKDGTALVFGYFRVDGINFEGATDEARARIHQLLHVVRVDDTPPEPVDRECGSYTLGPAAYVTDSVRDIVAVIERVERETGVHVKTFVSGRFQEVEPGVILEPARFTRTILSVSMVDGWLPWSGAGYGTIPIPANGARPVRFVMDYSMRRYVPKAERERQLGEVAKDVVP